MKKLRLNAPTKLVFFITLGLAVLALVAHFVNIPYVSAFSFYILLVAFVLLALSCVLSKL
jgi:hypothetical protein